MRTIIGLIALTALVSNATALQCLLCIGSTASDCARGDISAMVVQDCSAPLPTSVNPFLSKSNLFQQRDDVPIVNKCVSFVVENQGVTFVERGCGAIWEGVDICEYIEPLLNVKYCSTCDEDFCNNNPVGVRHIEPKVEMLGVRE